MAVSVCIQLWNPSHLIVSPSNFKRNFSMSLVLIQSWHKSFLLSGGIVTSPIGRDADPEQDGTSSISNTVHLLAPTPFLDIKHKISHLLRCKFTTNHWSIEFSWNTVAEPKYCNEDWLTETGHPSLYFPIYKCNLELQWALGCEATFTTVNHTHPCTYAHEVCPSLTLR